MEPNPQHRQWSLKPMHQVRSMKTGFEIDLVGFFGRKVVSCLYDIYLYDVAQP